MLGLKIEGGGGGSKKGSGLVHVPNDIYLKGCVNNIQDGLKVKLIYYYYYYYY